VDALRLYIYGGGHTARDKRERKRRMETGWMKGGVGTYMVQDMEEE